MSISINHTHAVSLALQSTCMRLLTGAKLNDLNTQYSMQSKYAKQLSHDGVK